MAGLWLACRDGDLDRAKNILSRPRRLSLGQLLNWVHPQAAREGSPSSSSSWCSCSQPGSGRELHLLASATPLGIAIRQRRHGMVALLLSFPELDPDLGRVLGRPCQSYLQNALCWHWDQPLHPLDRFLFRPRPCWQDHPTVCLLLADPRFPPPPELLMDVILHRDVRLFEHLVRHCAAAIEPNFSLGSGRSVLWYCLQNQVVPPTFLRMLLACSREVEVPCNVQLQPDAQGREVLALLQSYRESPQSTRQQLSRSLGWTL